MLTREEIARLRRVDSRNLVGFCCGHCCPPADPEHADAAAVVDALPALLDAAEALEELREANSAAVRASDAMVIVTGCLDSTYMRQANERLERALDRILGGKEVGMGEDVMCKCGHADFEHDVTLGCNACYLSVVPSCPLPRHAVLIAALAEMTEKYEAECRKREALERIVTK